MSILHPRETPDLFGHEETEAHLLAAWGSGRMAHAWLITGPRGIGKATLAHRFARFILAGEGQGGLFGAAPAAPAPARSLYLAPGHPVFQRVKAGGHADLRVVERGWDDKRKRRRGEIVVDDVRQIGAFLALTPAEGGWRVVVVDAADEMNLNAANALLKVLEEPPRRSILLLVAHNPGALLPTIRSRCRRLALKPLATPLVDELIRRHQPDIPDDDRAALVGLAEGSIGRALDLAGQGGVTLYRDMIGILKGAPRIDVPALHAFADRVAKGGDDGTAFHTLSELLTWWLARLVRRGTGAGGYDEVIPGEAELMTRLTRGGGLDQWVEVWEKITRLFARADAVSLDRRQVILNAFLAVGKLARS
ncbi:MAG: DNA polymerase III subunit delta' [Alphaproteobacteria bacterium]